MQTITDLDALGLDPVMDSLKLSQTINKEDDHTVDQKTQQNKDK